MKMHNTFKIWKQMVNDITPNAQLTCGIAILIALSCVFSVTPYYFNISEHFFSLESSAVVNGHVYKLFTYFLYHKNVIHFLLNAVLMVISCSGLERGIGTIRFLYRSFMLSFFNGLLHVLLESLLFSSSSRSSVNGLVPLSFSVLGLMTINSDMRKAYIMGINVPTVSLPWIILIIITLFFPNTAFVCNILAIVTGMLYGMGWFSLLEMSESKTSVLEKKIPFRLLKHLPGVQFIPGSTEERNKPLDLTDIPPGSYPVQTYVPVNATIGQSTGNQPNIDGWPISMYAQQQQQHTVPSFYTGVATAHNHGHSHCHGHGHSHHTDSPRMPVSPYIEPQFRPPVNMAGRPFRGLPTESGVSSIPTTSPDMSFSS